MQKLGEKLAQGSDYLTDEIRRYVQFRNWVHYDNFWKEIRVTRSRDKAVERLAEADYCGNLCRYRDEFLKSIVKHWRHYSMLNTP